MTHDYKRNGTTTLFAAIELTRGKVIASCMARQRHKKVGRARRALHDAAAVRLRNRNPLSRCAPGDSLNST
jgi:hypothetical protein